jgi:ribonucleoside-diphosphate reductase alpha chain
VTLREHVDVLKACAPFIDSSVSKTINFGSKERYPKSGITYDEFKNIYHEAYEAGCKSCTTFRIDGKKAGIFKLSEHEEEGEAPEGQSCVMDPQTNQTECG